MSQPTVTPRAPRFFRDDLARLNEILAPHVVTDPADGWQGIDTAAAPREAVTVYAELTSYGYANGWLA